MSQRGRTGEGAECIKVTLPACSVALVVEEAVTRRRVAPPGSASIRPHSEQFASSASFTMVAPAGSAGVPCVRRAESFVPSVSEACALAPAPGSRTVRRS